MAKIFVPAMLPGEIDRYIESDGKSDVKIRTWPDGTTEFDRGGMAILLGPGEIHEIGRVSRRDATQNDGTGVKSGAKAAAPDLPMGLHRTVTRMRKTRSAILKLPCEVRASMRVRESMARRMASGVARRIWG